MRGILKNRSGLWVGPVLALTLLWAAGARLGEGLPPQKPAPEAPEANQEQIDAARGSFERFLDSHPEIGNDVRSDPNNLTRPDWIHDHSELQAFLESHPLVKADPRAFVSPESWAYQNHRSNTDNLLSWFIPFSVFVCCLLAVLWVLRIVLENRRWNRSFKVHEEVHAKLIEKFGSSQDLAAYMESEAGKRLLEWTPPSFESPSRSMSLATGRILRSLQAGLILGLAGIGLLWVRDRIPGATEPLLIFGTLGVTIGAGFILSAVISYGLAKHLRLIGGGVEGESRLGQAPANR
jgi:hypothetical protein